MALALCVVACAGFVARAADKPSTQDAQRLFAEARARKIVPGAGEDDTELDPLWKAVDCGE